MLSNKSRAWLAALLYVVLIYLTLEVVRVPLSFLRERGMLRHTLHLLYGLITVGLLGILWLRSRSPMKIVAFLAAVGAYLYLSRFTKSPEEQVHFLEYGLAGILFARALRFHFSQLWAINIGALFLASLAGWLDEILQGLSATRHYDIRDVYLNIFSATLGLVVYRVVFQKRTDLTA